MQLSISRIDCSGRIDWLSGSLGSGSGHSARNPRHVNQRKRGKQLTPEKPISSEFLSTRGTMELDFEVVCTRYHFLLVPEEVFAKPSGRDLESTSAHLISYRLGFPSCFIVLGHLHCMPRTYCIRFSIFRV